MTYDDIHIISQTYHRNGVSGEGFVVTLFDWDSAVREYRQMDNPFVAVSFFGDDENDVKAMAARTAVLNIPLLGESNIGAGDDFNNWRGADHVGPVVAKAWIEGREARFEALIASTRSPVDA